MIGFPHPDKPTTHTASKMITASSAQNGVLKHGLELQAKFNTMCAFEYLKSRDIDIEVIQTALFSAIGPSNSVHH